MKRSPLRRKTRLRSVPNPTDPVVVQQLRMRCDNWCELCSSSPFLTGSDPHHRKMRSQGGKDELPNLIWVCHVHHRWIHAHPTEAYEKGWLVKSWQDPAGVTWVP